MAEKVPYWHVPVDIGVPTFVMTFEVEPKRVVKNPNFDFGSPYHNGAYLNRLQLSNEHGKAIRGPLLARQEGGRSITLDEEDSNVSIGDTEFATNIKGAGAFMLLPKRSTEWASRYINSKSEEMKSYFCYERARDILFLKDRHWHTLKVRELPNFCGFASAGSGRRRNYTLSLILDEDIDWGKAGPHRPLGGQDMDLAFTALRNSRAVYREELKTRICPVVSIAEITGNPALEQSCCKYTNCVDHIKGIKHAQEIRLLPSNVRISRGVGDIDTASLERDWKKIATSLSENGQDVRGFCENVIRGGIETLFLTQRTAMSTGGDKYSAYTYSDSDPPRDTVVDLKGRTYFVDLESLVQQEASSFWLLQKHTRGAIKDFANLLFAVAKVDDAIKNKVSMGASLIPYIKENYGGLIEKLSPEGISIRILPRDDIIRTHAELGEDAINYELGADNKWRQQIL